MSQRVVVEILRFDTGTEQALEIPAIVKLLHPIKRPPTPKLPSTSAVMRSPGSAALLLIKWQQMVKYLS